MGFGSVGTPELLILLLIFVGPTIFYLLTLQNALQRCQPQNRFLSPGNVWLLLIPIFHAFWNFVIVINISKSIGSEIKDREIMGPPYPGKGVGLAMCILHILVIIPVIGIISGIISFICWIVYWATIAGYSSKILYKTQATS